MKLMLFMAGAVLLVFVSTAKASKEGIIPLTNFHIESDGIGESGRIIVEGKQNETMQIVSVRISAFGRVFDVPKEKLAVLGELHANGIQISYARGYDEIGGRTLYVEFRMGWTSTSRMRAFVIVKQGGQIDVTTVQTFDTKTKKSPTNIPPVTIP